MLDPESSVNNFYLKSRIIHCFQIFMKSKLMDFLFSILDTTLDQSWSEILSVECADIMDLLGFQDLALHRYLQNLVQFQEQVSSSQPLGQPGQQLQLPV